MDLFSRLPEQLHWLIYSEWLTTYDDIVQLDIAMCNRELRKQFLSVKKKIRYLSVAYSSYVPWSQTWKVSRNIYIDFLQLEFQSPEEIGSLRHELMKEINELSICVSYVDETTFLDFSKLLYHLSSLTILYLDHGSVDPIPSCWSDEAVTHCSPLTYLSICKTWSFPISLENFSSLLHTYCPSLHTLQLLNMSIPLETIILECLPSLTQLTHLECIGLFNEDTTPFSNDSNRRYVNKLPCLQKLVLENIEVDGYYEFELLRLLFTFSKDSLEELTIKDILIHNQSATAEKSFWEETFMSCKKLKRLIYGGMFDETILRTLSQRFQSVLSSTTSTIPHHSRTSKASIEVLELIGHHTTLDSYRIPTECWESFGRHSCQELQSFVLSNYWKIFNTDLLTLGKTIANPNCLRILHIKG
jgi:hypothetical protein